MQMKNIYEWYSCNWINNRTIDKTKVSKQLFNIRIISCNESEMSQKIKENIIVILE